jgi:uncharacterized OsmC-like protein
MKTSVSEAQTAVRAAYKTQPELATVTTQAITGGTDITDPFHATVRTVDGGGCSIPFGTHRAVGGPYDAPCPGDLFCAALAACLDSSVRLAANVIGVELTDLKVHVRGTLDVRGAMGISRDVQGGFQRIESDVHLKAAPGTPPDKLELLQKAVDRCCVVGQTLKSPPPVQTTFHL